MGQSTPFRAKALVVEDDPMQREMIGLLLEESDFDVIECESAEAAELVLQRVADSLVLLMTDVNLAGGRHRACPCRQEVQPGARGDRDLGQAAAPGSARGRKILVKTMGAARCHLRGGADGAGAS